MRLELARSAGFCYGVRRAVQMAEMAAEGGRPCVMLGPIIHNPQVTGDLAARGVVTVSRPQETPAGYTLVIRSHGVAQAVEEEIQALGLPYVDATCPFVAKIHRLPAGRVRRAGPCWSQATKTIPRCRASWDTHGAVYLFLPIWRS